VAPPAEQSFEIEITSHAAPAELFDLLADIPRWQEWAGPTVQRSARDRDGSPEPNGVGAIRRLGAPGFWAREEIVEFLRPVRLSYILVSGVPVRRYRSTVEFEARGDGETIIRWRSRFEPIVPGTGALLRIGMRTVIAGVAKRLSAVAEQAHVRG
jgi:hypothetical protein